jgi:glycosyltransferase involved in cell wall biosynthesis
VACLRALRQAAEANLLVFAQAPEANAPFSEDTIGTLGHVRSRESETPSSILAAARDFQPDAVLVSGWADRGYATVCRSLKEAGVPVISGCDNQWLGTPRQLVAAWTAPWHIQRFIDVLWVAGERQRVFANALGYRGNRCWEGYYACDLQAFAAARLAAIASPPSFLFVGRYIPEKGIETLATAYRQYRERVAEPWPLICAGTGPLRGMLVKCGANDVGFVQPKDLPAVMGKAAAFILPSLFEPWGVVLQEAAAAGLPLIATRACGAAVHLLRDGWNGYACEPGCAASLADAMVSMHETDVRSRQAMGLAASDLAAQYSPQIWAKTLIRGVGRMRR